MTNASLKQYASRAAAYLSANWTALALGAAVLFVIVLWVTGAVEGYYKNKFWKDREAQIELANSLDDQARRHEQLAELAEDRAAKYESKYNLLAEQFERQAELLRKSDDARIRRQAAEIARVRDAYDAKIDEIASTPSDAQKCALCREAKRDGFTFTFCGVCER